MLFIANYCEGFIIGLNDHKFGGGCAIVCDNKRLQFLKTGVILGKGEIHLVGREAQVDEGHISNDVDFENVLFVNNIGKWDPQCAKVGRFQLDCKANLSIRLYFLNLSFGLSNCFTSSYVKF